VAKAVGFDDLSFVPALHRVRVPVDRTGKPMPIDPATQKTETISGFSEQAEYGGGHREGITSADESPGVIFVPDHSSRRPIVVDEPSRKVIATAPPGTGPDYVRFVAATSEVRVTEPSAQGIEEGPALVASTGGADLRCQ